MNRKKRVKRRFVHIRGGFWELHIKGASRELRISYIKYKKIVKMQSETVNRTSERQVIIQNQRAERSSNCTFIVFSLIWMVL